MPGNPEPKCEVIHPEDTVQRPRRGAAALPAVGRPHGNVAQEAQADGVERRTGWLLAEVSYGPPTDCSIKLHAGVRFVTSLAAGLRGAANVEPPTEDKALLGET